jgi:hypothetical protein
LSHFGSRLQAKADALLEKHLIEDPDALKCFSVSLAQDVTKSRSKEAVEETLSVRHKER